MDRIRFAIVTAAMVMLGCSQGYTQDTASSCLPILQARDYYKYASQNDLVDDYIRSINFRTWQTVQQSNGVDFGGLFAGGAFSLKDDYKQFDEKRAEYLDRRHYHRTEKQALDILAITIKNRAFESYDKCMAEVSEGPSLLIWPVKEEGDDILLNIKYVNGHSYGPASVLLVGGVIGGNVIGAPMGALWKGQKRLSHGVEFPITVHRSQGVSTTRVQVISSGGIPPVALFFERADALLSVKIIGTTTVLVRTDRSTSVQTPNNNERHDPGCDRYVGMWDGRYCTSATTATLTTTPPKYFTNVRQSASGSGAPYSTFDFKGSLGHPYLSKDGRTASATLWNWGAQAYVTVVADEYEKLSADQCDNQGPIPAIFGQDIVFSTLKICLPIAQLQWKLLPSGSQGTMNFGNKNSPDNEVVLDGSVVNSGDTLLAAYKVINKEGSESGYHSQ